MAVENLSQWKPPVGEERKYCPVGRLLEGGVAVAILDDKMNLQPVGVAGEIYVGGPTLAIGKKQLPFCHLLKKIATPQLMMG